MTALYGIIYQGLYFVILSRFKRHWFFLVLFAGAGLLFFKDLGKISLWDDEAHTAVAARNILQYGLPNVWDGRHLLTAFNGGDFSDNFLVSRPPWADLYLTAASFALLGEGTLQARLPFAMAGWLVLPLFYLLLLKWRCPRKLALTALIFLILDVQYILHIRQSRYYALLPLAFLIILLGRESLDREGSKGRWGGWAVYISGWLLLFQCHPVVYGATLVGEMTGRFLKRGRLEGSTLLIHLFVLILSVSWFWFVPGTLGELAGEAGGGHLVLLLWLTVQFIFLLNGVSYPLGLLLVVPTALRRARPAGEVPWVTLVAIAVANLVFVPYLSWGVIRYGIHLLLLMALLKGWSFYQLTEGRSLRTAVLPMTLFFVLFWVKVPESIGIGLLKVSGMGLSGSADQIAHWTGESRFKANRRLALWKDRLNRKGFLKWVRSDWFQLGVLHYAAEITRPYCDPMAEAVRILKADAHPDDLVVSNFDQTAIYFYTGLKVAGVASADSKFRSRLRGFPDYVTSTDRADWFIPRDIRLTHGPYTPPDEYLERLRSLGYRTIPVVLGCPERNWDGVWPERYKWYLEKHPLRSGLPEGLPAVMYKVER